MSPFAYPFASSAFAQEGRSWSLFAAIAPLTLWLTWSAP